MRRLYIFLFDTIMISVAYTLAHLLRFDFSLGMIDLWLFLKGLAAVLICKPLVFTSLGMYRNLWRYASLRDGIEILKAVSLGSSVSFLALLFLREYEVVSRSILVLDWLLLLSAMVGSRLAWRVMREHRMFLSAIGGERTLIAGAGEAGSLLLKEIHKLGKSCPYHVIGFVDDDRGKQKMKLHGVPVLGSTGQLEELLQRFRIENVIIAMPSAGKSTIRTIVDCCRENKVRSKTLPGIHGLVDSTISVASIKDVEIEDLLGRDPVCLDEKAIGRYLSDKRVLVSGAGGSIGSEICRQVAHFAPQKLVLLESAETPLYEIERELIALFPDLRIVPVIADVRNKSRIEELFDEFTPQVVFHAAAYKHVPMMEYNPAEAIANNCGGTKVLADTAHAFGVANFVMISTDKAVNPTNVMGASKRAAEIYVQSLASISKTKFTTVRFGNVLGSNGSVIPLFKEQIKNGGPITVTDKRVIRYFMTIPEASQLVMQAGCLGAGGDIFVLDMGEPVRIVDLAEELIRLSGMTPYVDIDIVFTGLRPGEKLFEELLIDGEGVKKTSHEKICVLESLTADRQQVVPLLNELLKAAERYDIPAVMELLKQVVPEFRPSYTFAKEPPFPLRRMRPDLYPRKPAPSNVIELVRG